MTPTLFQGAPSLRFLLEELDRGELGNALVRGIDLGAKDLSGRHWNDVELADTILDRTQLQGTHWTKTRLDGCHLKDSDWAASIVEDSQWERCNGIKTRLDRTKIRISRLSQWMAPHLRMRHVLWTGCLVKDMDLRYAQAQGSVFYRCEWEFNGNSGVTGMSQGDASKSLWIECRISGELLQGCALDGAAFVRCHFERVDWNEVDTRAVHFIDCHGNPEGLVVKKALTGGPMENWLERLRAGVDSLDEATLKDAVSVLLNQTSGAENRQRSRWDELEGMKTLGEVVSFLKRTLDIAELGKLSVEGGRVMVDVGNRKVELSDTQDVRPLGRVPEGSKPGPVNGTPAPERFRNLEL